MALPILASISSKRISERAQYHGHIGRSCHDLCDSRIMLFLFPCRTFLWSGALRPSSDYLFDCPCPLCGLTSLSLWFLLENSKPWGLIQRPSADVGWGYDGANTLQLETCYVQYYGLETAPGKKDQRQYNQHRFRRPEVNRVLVAPNVSGFPSCSPLHNYRKDRKKTCSSRKIQELHKSAQQFFKA